MKNKSEEKDKNKQKPVFLAILLIIITVAAALAAKITISKINSREIPFQTSYDIASKPQFYVYGDYIYCCTKDSLSIQNSENKIIYSDTYTINEPYMVTNNSIVAVTENNGYEVRVYDENGLIYAVTSPDPVVSTSTGENGHICIISKAGNMYKFDLYMPTSDGEYRNATHGELPAETLVPFASTVNDNSEVFALSILELSGAKPKTNICFYYYGDRPVSDDSDTDSDMDSSYSETNAFPGILKFMKNNGFVSVSEDKLIYSIFDIDSSEKLSEKWTLNFKNNITAIEFVNGEYVAVACGDKTTTAEGAEDAGTIVIYNRDGLRIGSFKAERAADCLTSFGNTILCISGRTIYCLDISGHKLWEYTHPQDILSAYPFLSEHHTFIASDTEAKIYTMSSVNIPPILEEEETEETTVRYTSNQIIPGLSGKLFPNAPSAESAEESTSVENDMPTDEDDADSAENTAEGE